MITKIVIKNFKKFQQAEIELGKEPILFVGQNNGGKTTALQAISLWSFLIKRWNTLKGHSQATRRTGAPIVRNTVSASPVRDIRLLWHDGEVQDKDSQKIKIAIIAYGNNDTRDWEYGIEATYQNQELLYCKPLNPKVAIPIEADRVFHLPPLSGVQTAEKKLDEGAQQQAVGEGRPGEILRNLLLRVQNEFPDKWEVLKKNARELFCVELQDIAYVSTVDPAIIVNYTQILPNDPKSKMQYEIASSGSGFLQYLLLMAFMYSHESNSVLLLDEPDSHMHTFLQRNTYGWLKETAAGTNSQLIISTHSEVLVDSTTDMRQITTFFGKTPQKLQYETRILNNVLREVSPLSIINAEWQGKILFAEGDTDLRLLQVYARVAMHPVSEKLKDIFFHPYKTNDIRDAMKYFQALRSIVHVDLKGFCLRDFVKTENRTQDAPFHVEYWNRIEIENYLIYKEALLRFVEKQMALFLPQAQKFLEMNLPKAVLDDPGKEDIKRKGSDFLEEFFTEIKLPISKGSYWQIANMMKTNEVHPDIIQMLDKINTFLS